MGLIKTLIIAVLIFFGGLFALGIYASQTGETEISQATIKPTITPSFHAISDKALFSRTQTWREKMGKQRYELSSELCTVADARLTQVEENWSHNEFFGSVYETSFNILGENLARGQFYEGDMLNAWLNSPSHRENLDLDFTHSCIKCDVYNDENYCVQIFGKY